MRKRAYPTHAKALFKPIRVSPRGRRQVGVTPLIRNYAEGFQKKGLKGIALARAIADDIAGFKVVELPQQKARELWVRRSAEEIIKTREVVIGKGENQIMGCTDMAQAAVAALRAARIPVLIIREHLHTSAKILLKIRNKWSLFEVDPFAEKKNRVKEITAAKQMAQEKAKKKGYFAEGPSLAQIGIRDYADFGRHEIRRRR